MAASRIKHKTRGNPRVSLPFLKWPEADRVAWFQAIQDGGLFDEQGKAAHWSERTRYSVKYDYAGWLYWCQAQYLLDISIADRVTPDTVDRYIQALQNRVSSVTVHNHLERLHRALSVMVPDTDWYWLKKIVNRLSKISVPKKNKPTRIQESLDLLQLGLDLMNQVPTPLLYPESPLTRKEALTLAISYRDGLIIALLAMRPIRRSNITSIEIGKQLIKIGEHWWLCFKPDETKQNRPLEFPLPEELIVYLERYLSIYRPCFPNADKHIALWASAKGCPLKSDGLYQLIIKRTKVKFGQSVNPHLFRDCAATCIARHTPEQVGIAAQILGHANLYTTERYYNQAGSISASRVYQATIDTIREGLKKPAYQREQR